MRRTSEFLLEMVYTYAEVFLTRGKAIEWIYSCPNRDSFCGAAGRLRRLGLIADAIPAGHPVLQLTPGSADRIKAFHRPERYWNDHWNEYWYLFVYDVPEAQRANRDALRTFLRTQRMGCLQRSSYVTPRDIRPLFDDLQRAASITDYAMLFEAQTVLGMPSSRVVLKAWPFDKIDPAQATFCRLCGAQIERLQRGDVPLKELDALVAEEMAAYIRVMQRDPLLPRALHHHNYWGPEVYRIHREFVRIAGRALR